MSENRGIKIYNLYPSALGNISDWIEHIKEIKDMGFDTIYINPIFETGYSKSIYAPKNFYNIDEVFLDPFSEFTGEEQLKLFTDAVHENGLKIIIEIILTHTAIDSELLMSHPSWYKYDGEGLKKYFPDGVDSQIEWGDMIEIDNENSIDRENLWQYWGNMIENYIGLGFDGFKCDAVNRVPYDLWKRLIDYAKGMDENLVFIGDNLGANIIEMLELTKAGFDYLFTSLKWWDFESTWFLEQHYKFKNYVKLISFPENHDTERVAKRYNGNEAALKMWYTISAFMNTGVMIPIGFEYGCRERLDVMSDFEYDIKESNLNIKSHIKWINGVKDSLTILKEESDIFIINVENSNAFVIKKLSKDRKEELLLVVNRNIESSETIEIKELSSILESGELVDYIEGKKVEENSIKFDLEAGGLKLFYNKF